MWIFWALLSTVAVSTRNIYSKKVVTDTSVVFTLWITFVVALIFGTVVVLFSGLRVSDSAFWWIVAIRVVADSIAIAAFIKALDMKSVNYVIPLLALLPVTSSISAYFVNGQTIAPTGMVGILIIVLSGFLLFSTEIKSAKSQASRRELIIATAYILVTILGWTIVDPIHKEGIERSDPYTYYFVGNVFFTLIFSILLVLKDRSAINKLVKRQYSPAVLLIGLLLGVEFLSQLIALDTGLTSFVVSIKSTNIALSSLLAWYFLKEKLSLLKILGITGALVGIFVLVFG